MLPYRFALTSELTTNELSPSELAQIAAAVDLQLTRDVAPAWPKTNPATMQAFPDPKAVPAGYDPFVIVPVSSMPSGALGYHYESHRQPAARLGFDPADPKGIATTTSHEATEAVVDPSGNRLWIASIPLPDGTVVRARVLIEAADPPEAQTYTIDDLPVSDFTFPEFWGPASRHQPGRHSPGLTFCGSIGQPLTVLPGGYLSYRGEDGVWWQVTYFDTHGPQVHRLGARTDEHRPHREWVDSQTRARVLPTPKHR